MPFFDLNTTEFPFDGSSFDYTIVGAGIAGILLAIELHKKGKKVLIFESGHWHEDENRQDLNSVVQTGKVLQNAIWGRKRAIGGTSIAWGGQSLPFSVLDFEERSWVPFSGWPIKYEDLASYYNQANSFMGVDTLNYEDDIFDLLKMNKIRFDESKLRYHFSKWAPQPNFFKLYKSYLKKNIPLVYNAQVTNLVFDQNGRVEYLKAENYQHKSVTVPIQNLLLATGAIEANRLLLLHQHALSKFNDKITGWLGKCFMDHPCIEAGYIVSQDMYALQKAFNTHLIKKRKYSLRLSLSEKVQTDCELLNASAGIMFYYSEDKFDPYVEIRNREWLRNKKIFAKIIQSKGAYLRSIKALLRDHLVYKDGAIARLVVMLEQEPSLNSFIALSNEIDRFGMFKARINWDIGKSTWDSMNYLVRAIEEEFKRLLIGKVKFHPSITSLNQEWKDGLSDVNHHMGGVRMSSRAEKGVVDPFLQVWGCDNLYVCSTAVFPTGSHSNPTLTMMALCLRLVDQLTTHR